MTIFVLTFMRKHQGFEKSVHRAVMMSSLSSSSCDCCKTTSVKLWVDLQGKDQPSAPLAVAANAVTFSLPFSEGRLDGGVSPSQLRYCLLMNQAQHPSKSSNTLLC
jgi:hypothetical protein